MITPIYVKDGDDEDVFDLWIIMMIMMKNKILMIMTPPIPHDDNDDDNTCLWQPSWSPPPPSAGPLPLPSLQPDFDYDGGGNNKHDDGIWWLYVLKVKYSNTKIFKQTQTPGKRQLPLLFLWNLSGQCHTD